MRVWRYEVSADLEISEIRDEVRAELERALRERLPAFSVKLSREPNVRVLQVKGVVETETQAAAVAQLETVVNSALNALELHPDDRIWKECCVRPGY